MFIGKKGFSLIEMIFAIVILAFVLIGGFQIVGKLYKRNFIVKQTSKMEFISQEALDQIALILYYRVPLSVIGYDGKGDFKYIGEIDERDKYKILEWIGYLNDAMIERNLSGFIDLYASKSPILKALDFNSKFVNEIVKNKFKKGDLKTSCGIIFAGSFDEGEEAVLIDYNNSFGWHNKLANHVYNIEKYVQQGNDCNITISRASDGAKKGFKVYEKFYLVDSAYAIAKAVDINKSASCIKDLNKSGEIDDNTLLLFYDYRPWRGETFCADDYGNPNGKVSVLAFDVDAFRVRKINNHLEIKIELFKRKGDINISVAKQKVAF